MFEVPAAHCPPVQDEVVAGFALGRAAVQLLLGARYVIVLSDGGVLLIMQRDELAERWGDQPVPMGPCASA